MAGSDWASASYVRTNGVRLHVRFAGPPAGAAAVLLHGFPESGEAWRWHARELAREGLRVIAPDLRGYGLSEAPARIEAYRLETLAADIIGLADALGLERFVLAGHDWGGLVAWSVAAARPERLRRLVILNAPHPDVIAPTVRRHPGQLLRGAYVGFFQLGGLAEAALRARGFALLRRTLIATSRPGAFTAADLERHASEWARAGRLRGMLSYYRAFVRHRPRPLGRIEPPVDILWGMRDAALRPELGQASLERCADGRLVRFETASHWLHREEPEAVVRAIAAPRPR